MNVTMCPIVTLPFSFLALFLVSTNSWGKYLTLRLINAPLCSPDRWEMCLFAVFVLSRCFTEATSENSCLLWLGDRRRRKRRRRKRRRRRRRRRRRTRRRRTRRKRQRTRRRRRRKRRRRTRRGRTRGKRRRTPRRRSRKIKRKKEE